MNDLALARALHVLGVVLWIGGVAFVTLALLPGLHDLRKAQRGTEPLGVFEVFEHRFARQARFTTQLTGLTGLYMLWRLDLWSRFTDPAWWWLHAMVLLYLFFTLMLFVLEPFVLRGHFGRHAQRDPAGTQRRVLWLHRVLLVLALITIFGAVAGSHGWLIGQ